MNIVVSVLEDPTFLYRKIHIVLILLHCSHNFRNPYPRPVNLPPGSYTKKEGKKTGTRIERLNEMSKPIYVKSIDESVKNTEGQTT